MTSKSPFPQSCGSSVINPTGFQSQIPWWFSVLCFPGGTEVKASTCNAGDLGLIPRLGRFPGEGKGYPLQYSGLENSMDRGAWQTTVHGAAKSQTQLNNFPIELSLILVDQSELCKVSHLVKSEESRLASSVLHQFSSVQSLIRVRLCDAMNRSTPGLPVQHQLPEFTQTHSRVSDAIRPSHSLSSPFPPALNPSQHHSLFQ